ncbi:hypothetical protein CPB86DRAFT_790788 [Serendipita vermifera]|nr:hypothetical protein CPB86DRAFT_790788 [Serendipita vermifera]
MESPIAPPLTLGPPQPSILSIDKKEKAPSEGIRKRALHSSKARFWIHVITISAYGTAVVLAIVHYIFLANLNQRDTAQYSTDTRAWVGRASNLLSRIIATSLGAVVTTALVQASWNAITSEYTPVGVVDDLFSLPSPVAVVSLLYKYPKTRLLPLVGLAILTQALVLVSVLAPNALSIDTNRDMPVPKLDIIDLLRIPEIWWDEILLPYVGDENYASSQPSVGNQPPKSWSVSPECGASCTFQRTYKAPGISCRQMSEQETGLKPFDPQSLQDTNWWWLGYDSRPRAVSWGASDIHLNFSFVPLNGQMYRNNTLISLNQTGPVQGHLCSFHDATYRANFTYKDNKKSIGLEVVSDTNEISENCPWTGRGNSSRNCSQYASAAAYLAIGYQNLFAGNLSWSSVGFRNWMPSLSSWFIDYDYDYTSSDGIDTISLAPYPNTSQIVERSFSTATLSLLLWMNQTESASVKIENGSTWLFNPLELWVIYGSALFLVLVAGLYGLHLSRVGDIVREKKFSSFLIATRTNDLGDVYVQNYETVISTKLRHDAETGYFLVSKDETNDQMPHDRAPEYAALDENTTHGWTRSVMVVSLLLALGFVLGHHFYLNDLHNSDANKYPQYWIKGASNAFSQAVSICLGIAAAYSLTQASWRALKLHGGSVETIDNLFSLPSPFSVVSLVKEARQIQTIYLIVIAVAIQGLGFVTTFAPNALTIVDSTPSTSMDLSVPTLNLSVVYYSQSTEWQRLMDNLGEVEAEPPKSGWPVPLGCGAACTFKIQYDAPALSCRDILPNESSVTPYNPNVDYPEGIWRFYDLNVTKLLDFQWSNNNPEFILSYIPMTYYFDNSSMTSSGSPAGSVCQCRDGRYEVDFEYSSHGINLTPALLSYNNAFTSTCTEVDSEVATSACQIYKNNSVEICRGFLEPFRWYKGINVTENRPDDFVWDETVFPNYFDMNLSWEEDRLLYFRPKITNSSKTLSSLFANLTAGLVPILKEITNVPVKIAYYPQRWNYEPKELFAAYIPGLVVILAIVVYGLYCIHANGRVMDGKFSTLVLTTRSGKLDGVYDKVDNFDELMEEKLVYAKRGCFVPETEEPSEPQLKQA